MTAKTEMRRCVVEMREMGMTFTDIGKRFGVTSQAARMAYKKEVQWISLMNKRHGDGLYQRLESAKRAIGATDALVARCYRQFKRAGIHTADELDDASDFELLSIRNIGEKSLELAKAAQRSNR